MPATGEITTVQETETPIRDAACLVVVDTSASEPTVLMGRRHASQIFLPDKWVFPGGRLEDDDRVLASRFDSDFKPADLAHEIRPFALAAIRELCEETGLIIGRDGALIDQSAAWRAFAASGHAPAPGALLPFARAVTPPGRIRRYDTWFFVAKADAVSGKGAPPDGELLDLGWFTFSQAAELDLPHITKLVLEDIVALLKADPSISGLNDLLPFYHSAGTAYRRDLISCKVAPPLP
ncbi:NUDIX hydrolase [Hyphomicrobium sp.]|uniref:NUDIX hydrolase n=1 Tax=Hyphomicrobium sp. TaxID=82 RepID=UPI002D79056B|nr:NUDIX hydrolase [Hyphomicrobium sp.]HET6389957.1 NUDIX hydrolase [Hyphomicrobium sp.]